MAELEEQLELLSEQARHDRLAAQEVSSADEVSLIYLFESGINITFYASFLWYFSGYGLNL